MILGITIEAEYQWGYWIRTPFTSKIQTTFPLPPPTTIIGALSSYLVREELIKDPAGGKVSGELFKVEVREKKKLKIDFRSPAAFLDDALITASAAIPEDRKAFIIDDLNKYVTLLFQEKKILEKVHGEKIPRRYLPKYRTGAILCGKVYYPSGPIKAVCLFDLPKLEQIIDGDPVKVLIEAAWNINRIGSKESLVIVRSVSYRELEKSEISRGNVKTRFYFPSRAGRILYGDYYTEVFWRRGWGRYDTPIFEEYVIPGSRNPVTSFDITVDAESYVKLDENVTVIFPNLGR